MSNGSSTSSMGSTRRNFTSSTDALPPKDMPSGKEPEKVVLLETKNKCNETRIH